MSLLKKYPLTIFSIIFFEFLIMGVFLGTLPGFIHETLKYSNVIVGVIIGLQYAATLFTRHLAGQHTDSKGGKATATIGLILSLIAVLCSLLSLYFFNHPLNSLILLALGRVLLGVGESFLVIGIFAWGFTLLGNQNSSKVMILNGLGMHAGMACGAPLGIFLNLHLGIIASFACMLILPVLSYLMTLTLPAIPHQQLEKRLQFYSAVGLIWQSGTGMALAIVGFGCIASFITLYFLQQGWANASLALTSFGVGYIGSRLLFSHFPDKFGGAKVAIVCLLLEITGQLLIWLAPSGPVAIAGAMLTGCGVSLIFPSFGKIAIKNIPATNYGMAMAAYNAFFDLSVGLTAPLAGLIAVWFNYQAIYLFGGLGGIIALALAFQEYRRDVTHQLKRPKFHIVDNQ